MASDSSCIIYTPPSTMETPVDRGYSDGIRSFTSEMNDCSSVSVKYIIMAANIFSQILIPDKTLSFSSFTKKSLNCSINECYYT